MLFLHPWQALYENFEEEVHVGNARPAPKLGAGQDRRERRIIRKLRLITWLKIEAPGIWRGTYKLRPSPWRPPRF